MSKRNNFNYHKNCHEKNNILTVTLATFARTKALADLRY